MTRLTLVSHHLCPYVQRAVIALAEKRARFERVYVDLSNKPNWFLEVSPLGKTPVLLVDGEPVFESAVILEYLEDTRRPRLHPAHALTRARHRGWIEFASAILDDIAGLYNAADAALFEAKRGRLAGRFDQLEAALGRGPWFAGETFHLMDGVYGPVFRYFDVFERFVALRLFEERPKLAAWRARVSARPSVRAAAPADYSERLLDFLRRRASHISTLVPPSPAV
jgi:glutathione S-transferase